MISFIIIGRNEGWKLTKCLKSVFNTITFNKLENYEVIFIDSNSQDDSINRAKIFSEVRIYKLIEDYNAAIARNLGAQKSNGELFFFIDADMEIMPNFLRLVYDENHGLYSNFISGRLINYYYNSDAQLVSQDIYNKSNNDRIESTTGGLFLITRDNWNLIEGMRNVFNKSQDIDLALRLAKRNIFLTRKKEIAAIHHTIPYKGNLRIWKDFINKNHLYARSLLYRKNILNFYMYKRLVRNDYTLIILFLLTIISLVFKDLILMNLYFFVLLIRTLNIKKKESSTNILSLIIFYMLRDVTTFIGFFIFFPKTKFKIKFRTIL